MSDRPRFNWCRRSIAQMLRERRRGRRWPERRMRWYKESTHQQSRPAVLLMLAMAVDMFFAARPLEAAVVTLTGSRFVQTGRLACTPTSESIDPQSAKSALSPRGLVRMDSTYGLSADFLGFSARGRWEFRADSVYFCTKSPLSILPTAGYRFRVLK